MWALEEAGWMRVDSGQVVLNDSLLNSDSLTHRWLTFPASQDRAGLFRWISQPHPYSSLIPENKVGVPHQVVLLQEGGPLPGPKTGLLSNTRKWIARGDTSADKARDFTGKGPPGGEQMVREARRAALPHGSQSQVYGDGISFWVVFSQSFWLRVLPGGARLVQPRGMPERRILGGVGQVVSPFDLSRTLPVGCGLLVLCSLPGPPVVKQLMQMVTVVPGQGGRFQSACFP